ncbi:hypothetical protein [Paraliomyxa miuraensis]|uniref:hypothetical protein n=1 Tax=Paraliomyxa miuraensis TaxID=376150 RepID=UPI002253A17B|nr:hypothetical protein [Paraliomyxa miuraensis]MCX4239638.1 hypothetical protein [Paraliomyxa miuraensis]
MSRLIMHQARADQGATKHCSIVPPQRSYHTIAFPRPSYGSVLLGHKATRFEYSHQHAYFLSVSTHRVPDIVDDLIFP